MSQRSYRNRIGILGWVLLAALETAAMPLRAQSEGTVGAGVPSVVLVAVDPVDEEPSTDAALEALLATLEVEEGILPAEEFTSAADALGFNSDGGRVDDDVLVLPLREAAPSERRLHLLFVRSSQRSYFLSALPKADGTAEVRLWGAGPTEILVDTRGISVHDEPSSGTFRLAGAAIIEGQGFADDLRCLARELGLTLNPQNLRNLLLSEVACTAANRIALVLTAYSCLNFFTPIGAVGCTTGLVKILACGFARCDNPPAGACRGEIAVGQRLSGSWSSACPSARRAGRFARYFTFSLATPTTVQIDLGSAVDSYLYLTPGDGGGSTVVEEDNNDGPFFDARIERALPAGTYTIEVTTFSSGRTGSFTLTLGQR